MQVNEYKNMITMLERYCKIKEQNEKVIRFTHNAIKIKFIGNSQSLNTR